MLLIIVVGKLSTVQSGMKLSFPSSLRKAAEWERNISTDHIRSHYTANHFNCNFQLIFPSLPLQFSL